MKRVEIDKREIRGGTEDLPLFQPILRVSKQVYLVLAFLLAIILWGFYAWFRQFHLGLGVTGMNRPVFWGVYATNFVFFIGISHAGTLISSILRITKTEWRRAFTRAAEAVTVLSLPFGALSVIVDLGRPDRMLNLFTHGRIQSPILWDVICITAYLLTSCLYFYIALIPDIAECRDRLYRISGLRRFLYRTLSLGWKGTEKQWKILERIMAAMAVFLFMLVISVHTNVSFIFGVTLQPGWNTAIIGPYFVVGAIFSGVGTVIVIAALLRKLYHLEDYIRPAHFESAAKFLLTLCLFWFYFTFVEYLVAIYSHEPAHMEVINATLFGEFAHLFWLMFFLCFIIPLSILINRRTRTITGVVIASILLNIGMWLERYTIIIPSLTRPRLPYSPGFYIPTWVEGSVTASFFAGFILLYIIFAKVFPVVTVWEVREGREKALEEYKERMKGFLPPETGLKPESPFKKIIGMKDQIIGEEEK